MRATGRGGWATSFALATASYYLIERRALRLKARLNPLDERADKADWPGVAEIGPNHRDEVRD